MYTCVFKASSANLLPLRLPTLCSIAKQNFKWFHSNTPISSIYSYIIIIRRCVYVLVVVIILCTNNHMKMGELNLYYIYI